MQIKHNDLVIPESNPFENCVLKRKQYADILTSIVQNYADGFVLAINNEWGTGKTTFVKMWQQQLNNEEFKTLYFNAWENDYGDDVLIALISGLNELNPGAQKDKYQTVLKKAAPLAKKLIPSITKALAKRYVGEELVQELINGTMQVGVEEMTKAVEAYGKRKKSVDDFRKSLEDFVKAETADKPVVFIIDELDRCRPNYAVEVLEQIKHLFSVPGIVFVLSIDKDELGNAVRGAYGSEKIKADEYLRRFIDLEYSIPEPSIRDFCEYMIKYYKFETFLNSEERFHISDFKNDESYLVDFSEVLFTSYNLNLRKIEKIYAHMRLVLNSFTLNSYVFPGSLLFLINILHRNREIINSIVNKKYTIQQFLTTVESELPKNMNRKSRRLVIYIISELLWFYSKYIAIEKVESPLLIKDLQSGDYKVKLKSTVDETEEIEIINRFVSEFNFKHQYRETKISYMIDKILLTQPFTKSK